MLQKPTGYWSKSKIPKTGFYIYFGRRNLFISLWPVILLEGLETISLRINTNGKQECYYNSAVDQSNMDFYFDILTASES